MTPEADSAAMAEEYEQLIVAAQKCATACERCALACLHENEVAMLRRCISLDTDCAELCELVAAFAARGSNFTPLLAAILADACKACGEECSRHKMAHCQACAGACRACQSACGSVSSPHQPG